MGRNIHYHENWMEHDGKTVRIDGHSYRLKVSTYEATYPYRHTAISVMAEPKDKDSEMYRRTRKDLGDDWSTDVLESDISLQANVLHQCLKQDAKVYIKAYAKEHPETLPEVLKTLYEHRLSHLIDRNGRF